jgi:hypothetical protein
MESYLLSHGLKALLHQIILIYSDAVDVGNGEEPE